MDSLCKATTVARLQGVAVTGVILALLALSANLCAQSAEKKTPLASASADAQRGRRIFAQKGCYECHGFEGQGSPIAGPRLGPDPAPFDAFVSYVRNPAGEMPPYSAKVLSERELADIYEFLKLQPRPPDPKSLKLLNQ